MIHSLGSESIKYLHSKDFFYSFHIVLFPRRFFFFVLKLCQIQLKWFNISANNIHLMSSILAIELQSYDFYSIRFQKNHLYQFLYNFILYSVCLICFNIRFNWKVNYIYNYSLELITILRLIKCFYLFLFFFLLFSNFSKFCFILKISIDPIQLRKCSSNCSGKRLQYGSILDIFSDFGISFSFLF